LGYGQIVSLLLTAPPYVLGVICAVTNAWHADRSGERYFHVTIGLYIAVVAFIIAATTSTVAPRYLSMMLMIPGVYIGFVVALGWISNIIPRPPAKRAASLAMITAIGNTANIFASYMYADSFAPQYVVAMSVCSASAFIAIVSATVLRFILTSLNKKLERGELVDGYIVDPAVAHAADENTTRFRFLL
jgi:hypothetical protein